MKYVVEDTTMTGIADAIREKASTTANMTPEQMISTIASIVTGSGGGGGSDGTFAQGTITPAEDIAMIYSQYTDERYSIEHGLGTTPNMVTIWAEITLEESYIPSSGSFVMAVLMPNTYRNCYQIRTTNATGTTTIEVSATDSARSIVTCDETTIKIGSGNRSYLRAGRTYYWAVANIPL